jgi:hypothetical protein
MPAAFRLLSGIGRKLVTDLLPAALASGLVGLIFSHLVTPPAPSANAADMERMVHDAQKLAQNYTRKEEELRRQMAMTTVLVRPVEPVAAKRDIGSARDAKPTLASVSREAPAKKLVSPTQPAATDPAVEKPQPSEPLLLSNFTTIPPRPAEPENFLAATWHDVVSVVKKVPGWAGSATDFALELAATRSIHESHLPGGGFR